MLEEQIKQASNDVMKAVGEYLLERAKTDASVARSIEKESKSLKECFNYIVGEASKQQKEGCAPIKDDDVYGMAVHYYDEDDIKIESLPTGTKAEVSSSAASPKIPPVAQKKEKKANTHKKKNDALEGQMTLF